MLKCTLFSGAVMERAQAAFRPATGSRGQLAARRASSTVCMAHPRRVAKVAKQIEREIGNLLITDKILQAAVCPERRRGFDGALSALASVTEVQISNDLQVAKVYLSIYSDDMGKAAAMEGLQRLEGYVRKHIGKQVRLRLTPEIRFVHDDSIERTERIFKLLDQVKKIDSGEAEPPPLAFYGEVEEDEEEWEEEEEEDDGIFKTVDLGMFAHEHESSSPSSSSKGSSGSKKAAAAPAAAASASRQQPARQKQGGGGKQASSSSSKGQEDEEDMQAILAEFKRQVDARKGRLQ